MDESCPTFLSFYCISLYNTFVVVCSKNLLVLQKNNKTCLFEQVLFSKAGCDKLERMTQLIHVVTYIQGVFLDTQVSLAPTHVSPSVRPLVSHTFGFPISGQ